jgi:hypothetical protein
VKAVYTRPRGEMAKLQNMLVSIGQQLVKENCTSFFGIANVCG